jgi:TRAP transporter TAXI family solute receptor
MRRITRRTFLGAVGAGATALGTLPGSDVAPAGAQVTKRLSIATGGTGGVYYPVGGGIAALISKYAPGVEATAEATAASADNLKLLHAGQVALGLTGADIAAEAARGQLKGLPEKVAVRTLASIYANFMHIVTLEGSEIRSVPDLKGKRVSMGAPGSGTEIKGLRILDTYGLTPKDLRSHDRLSVVESVGAIKDHKIDAFFWNSAVPTGAILDLAATPGLRMRLVPHAEIVPKLVQKHGAFYFAGVIPRGAYKGIETDVPVAAETHALVAHERMEEPLAYQITKILLEHTPELVAVHSAAKELTPTGAVQGSAVPFHPGAIRYYRERGIAVPA